MKKLLFIALLLPLGLMAQKKATHIQKLHIAKQHDSTQTNRCDSATKRLMVEYWKVQCERVKHHNKVLPEEMEYIPILSPDSCSVFFPL